jgi:hypothetical protein
MVSGPPAARTDPLRMNAFSPGIASRFCWRAPVLVESQSWGVVQVQSPGLVKYRRFTRRRYAPNTGKVIEIAKEKGASAEQANNRSEKQEKPGKELGDRLRPVVPRQARGRLMDGRGVERQNAKRPAARSSGREKARLGFQPSPNWRGNASKRREALPLSPLYWGREGDNHLCSVSCAIGDPRRPLRMKVSALSMRDVGIVFLLRIRSAEGTSRTMGRESMRSHASRACPTCGSIVPNSGRPKFGVRRRPSRRPRFAGLLRMRAD